MPKIKTLIRTEAHQIRIVSLCKGDCYKRLAPSRYDTKKTEIQFGVVTDVMASDDAGAVVGIEYALSYGTVEARIATLTSDDDAAIFPATPQEVSAYFSELRATAEKNVRTKLHELGDSERKLAQIEEILSWDLTTPAVESIVTGEVEA